MIDSLISALGLELGLTSHEIADVVWLALKMQESDRPQGVESNVVEVPEPLQQESARSASEQSSSRSESDDRAISNPEPKVGLPNSDSQQSSGITGGMIVKVPDARSLREPLSLARALKPLLRQVTMGWSPVLDEVATVERIVEEQLWLPVMMPSLEPWLELALVVDDSVSMQVWRRTVEEFQRILEHYGVFRDVRVWRMVARTGEVLIRPGIGKSTQQLRRPSELIDPSGRRLIFVVTDCVAALWKDGTVQPTLKLWATNGPMAIVQMLPEWLWSRTGLGFASSVRLQSLLPGVPNQQLAIRDLSPWDEIDLVAGIRVPVVTLEPEPFGAWAQMMTGKGGAWATGVVFEPHEGNAGEIDFLLGGEMTAESRVQQFRVTASPMARQLAGLLAAAPVISLPVVRIIQERMLRESRQVHVAEVFLGGLLKPLVEILPETNVDRVPYEFLDGVRDILLESVATSTSINMLNEVSQFVAERLGLSMDSFTAVLRNPQDVENQDLVGELRPFAIVTAQILRQLAGEYAQFAEHLEEQLLRRDFLEHDQSTARKNLFSHTHISELIENTSVVAIEEQEIKIEFNILKLEVQELGMSPQVTVSVGNANGYMEKINNEVMIEMIKIPKGIFQMGAQDNERGSTDRERPSHLVAMPEFWIGAYPVTQNQWQAIAKLPKIERDLKINLSTFKGENRPVENVSWLDSIEFCKRLSELTRRNYRLPSEAEWEYACRAGTITPFHFGETISTEFSNYRPIKDNLSLNNGTYRGETSNVGGNNSRNLFGVSEMHGNVFEWCLDHWHQNYEGAPTDGEAWMSDNFDAPRVLRGGSWYDPLEKCRSAYRHKELIHNKHFFTGLRIVR